VTACVGDQREGTVLVPRHEVARAVVVQIADGDLLDRDRLVGFVASRADPRRLGVERAVAAAPPHGNRVSEARNADEIGATVAVGGDEGVVGHDSCRLDVEPVGAAGRRALCRRRGDSERRGQRNGAATTICTSLRIAILLELLPAADDGQSTQRAAIRSAA
jgi:hypothetical protein